MGTCHGKAGVPVELQALPEAWGDGGRRSKASILSNRPKSRLCTPLQTKDIKIEPVDADVTADDVVAQDDNDGQIGNFFKRTSLIEEDGRYHYVGDSGCSRHQLGDISPVSEARSVGSGPMDDRGDEDGVRQASEPGGLPQRGHCAGEKDCICTGVMLKCSALFLTEMNSMFTSQLGKLQNHHTITRSQIRKDLLDEREQRQNENATIANDVKELQQFVNIQSRVIQSHLRTHTKPVKSRSTQTSTNSAGKQARSGLKDVMSSSIPKPTATSFSTAHVAAKRGTRIPVSVRRIKSVSRVPDVKKPAVGAIDDRSEHARVIFMPSDVAVAKQRSAKSAKEKRKKETLKKLNLSHSKQAYFRI